MALSSSKFYPFYLLEFCPDKKSNAEHFFRLVGKAKDNPESKRTIFHPSVCSHWMLDPKKCVP